MKYREKTLEEIAVIQHVVLIFTEEKKGEKAVSYQILRSSPFLPESTQSEGSSMKEMRIETNIYLHKPSLPNSLETTLPCCHRTF